jgi:hypothetical protein
VASVPFTNPLVAGTTLIREAIQSKNYIAGVQGWIIKANGDAEFNNLTVRGTVIVRNTNGQGFILDPVLGEIQVYSPDSTTGVTVTPGVIKPFLADAGPVSIAFLDIETATVDGQDPAIIRMSSESADGTSVQPRVQIFADLYSIDNYDMGRGVVATWSSPVDSGVINATELSVLASPALTPFTYKANRAFRVQVSGGFSCTSGVGNPIWRLRKTNAVGATVCYFRRTPTNTAGADEALNLSQIFTTGVNDVTTILTVCCTGTGAYDTTMNGQFGGRSVTITDIGPASAYPSANVLT